MQSKRYLKYSLLIVLVLLNISISVYFVLNHGILNTDILFHYERLRGLGTLLFHGQYPLIREQFGTLQGNALYIMYPWLTLVPFLPVLLFSEHTAIFLLEISIIALIYCISFFAPCPLHWNYYRRLMFSLLYTSLAEPSITLRGDVGLSLAMAFLPLVLFGLYSLIVNHKLLELLVGLLLVSYSHIPTAFLLVIILLIIMACNPSIAKRNYSRILKIIVGFTLGTILEWLPIAMLSLDNHIMSPRIPYRTPHTPYPFCSDSITTFLPLFVLVLPILLIFASNFKAPRLDESVFMIGTFCALMDIKYFGGVLVQFFTPLRVLQFGSRFLPFTILFWTFLICKNTYLINSKRAYQLLHLCIGGALFFTMFLSASKSAISPRTNDYHHLSDFQGYLLPRASHRMPYQFHYASEYDYAPQPAVYYRHLCHWSTFYATSHGLVLKDGPHIKNDVLPITIYHGVSYHIIMNNHTLHHSQINKNLSNKYQLLTLRHSPNKPSLLRISSETLDK